MFLVLRVVLVVVLAARTCEAAALGASGPKVVVAQGDLDVIRELEELNEKIRIADDLANRHKSEARVVPADGVREEDEEKDTDPDAETASATVSPGQVTTGPPAADVSAPADNELASPPLTSPPTGTTPTVSTLSEALAYVLSKFLSNTSAPSVLSASSSNTPVPPTSDISTSPELGNDTENASQPVLPEENTPPSNVAAGGLKAFLDNAVSQDVDLLHPHLANEPTAQHLQHVPEQPSGGDYLCPDRYYRLGRTCYRPSDRRLSFFSATQDCRAENGDLAIIKDPPSHRFVIQLIQTYHPRESHWIGLSDMLQEGVFLWSDGIPLEGTTFWAIGQPNNLGHSQHCVYMYPKYGCKWMDGDCSDQYYYVCQQPTVNSVDQLIYSYLNDYGALGEHEVGGYVEEPTPPELT